MKDIFARMASGTIRFDDDLIFILDALPVPLTWASLPDGNMRFVNRAFTKTFGYQNGHFATIDQWVSQTYADEAEKAQARQRWDEFWNCGRRGITEVQPLELHINDINDKTIVVLHRGIVLHDFNLWMATYEDLSTQKLAESALKRIAYEDPLTGLGNRRALQEHWDSEMARSLATASQRMIAILMIDLDNFKPINDYFGHAAGDDILRMVAIRLRQSVRQNDRVVRMGGDEFAILLTNLEDQDDAEKICQRISDAFAKPFIIQGEEIDVGATVGASLYPHHAGNLETLLHAADQALYRLKRNHTHDWEWFNRSFEPIQSPQTQTAVA